MKLKYKNEKSRPQAKFFYNICHSRKHTINEIMSESEIQVLRMPIAGEFFYNNCHSRTQIINEIINEIEIQKRRKTAAGEFSFTAVVTVCIQIMNQIVKEIDIQEREKPAAGEIFLQHLSQSLTYN